MRVVSSFSGCVVEITERRMRRTGNGVVVYEKSVKQVFVFVISVISSFLSLVPVALSVRRPQLDQRT